MSHDESIYSVKKTNPINLPIQEISTITDECDFWSSLSGCSTKLRHMNISCLPNKSFFSEKTSRLWFDIHRLPTQSLLKLAGKILTRQVVPRVRRAHGKGAIFALASSQQRLFSIDYHHEGGAHHWYIIPNRERQKLQAMFDQRYGTICLDHGELLIDPSALDKNHIRYYRSIQCANEFVVVSAGTLMQGFTEDASWSESISFVLPSWMEGGHAHVPIPSCKCDIFRHSSLELENIDVTFFRHELIQRYIASYLNPVVDGKSLAGKGS